MTQGSTGNEFDAVARRLVDLAGKDPQAALKVLAVLGSVNPQNDGRTNLVPAVAMAAALVAGLGASLSLSQRSPERQADMRAAASNMLDAIEASTTDMSKRAELMVVLSGLVFGTPALPIHELDPRAKIYEGMLAEKNRQNPSSGGFAEGGQVTVTPHTGGKQLDGQSGSGTYVTPEHQQNPGLVFNENTGYDFKPADRSGIKFDTSIVNKPNGALEIELSVRQKFDKNGVIVDSKFAHTDLVARFAPETGLFIEWYGTTVKGRNIGTELISRAIEEVGPTRVKQVSATLGNDNREAYQTARDAGLPADQAVWGTPLGKTMSSLGFKNVEVTSSYSVKFRY
ncbi:hypothetical protein [Pseudomonas mosselii]|nr:hypothetical protein [Pseudomonas mosselii]MCL8343166.1 hypothetical protein [Pseudomonas mosselii]WJR26926.1 hypothetical protein LU678_021500 [Pseudomonas mosselii]